MNFHGQKRFPAKREARNEPPDVGLAGTIACAHALVTGTARVTILARLHLNALQRTIVAVIAVEHTALYAATNIRIGILLIHNPFLPKYICPETSLFFPSLARIIRSFAAQIFTHETIDKIRLQRYNSFVDRSCTFSSVGRAPDS